MKNRIKKEILACGLALTVMISLCGCGQNLFPEPKADAKESTNEQADPYEEELKELDRIGLSCRDIYRAALQKGGVGTDQARDGMISKIADLGYPVVDINNHVDMKNAASLERFCKAVSDQEKAQITVIRVTDNDGLVSCRMTTSNGEVNIVRTVLKWNADGNADTFFVEDYQAQYWIYTQNGYLIFEKELPSGYDGASGHDAIRVKPLDSELRGLAAKYIDSIGYDGNNMFLINWNQEDYGELCFEDLYGSFYKLKSGVALKAAPGETVVVAGDKMSGMMKQFLNVSDETLQKSMKYDSSNQLYQWTNRSEYPSIEMPYPEVVASEKTEDNKLILTVNAVWPYRNTDKAYAHKVTIQLGDGGSYKYISNEIVEDKTNIYPEYIPRD